MVAWDFFHQQYIPQPGFFSFLNFSLPRLGDRLEFVISLKVSGPVEHWPVHPGYSPYLGDGKLPSYIGIIFFSHYKDPYYTARIQCEQEKPLLPVRSSEHFRSKVHGSIFLLTPRIQVGEWFSSFRCNLTSGNVDVYKHVKGSSERSSMFCLSCHMSHVSDFLPRIFLKVWSYIFHFSKLHLSCVLPWWFHPCQKPWHLQTAPDARQISSKAHCKGWTLQLIEYETVPTTFEYIEVGFHLGKSFISTVLWNGRNAKTAVLRISKKRLWQNSVTGLKGICEHWWVESCISNWCFKYLGPQAVKIG